MPIFPYINVSLVIGSSGSMGGTTRAEFVKQLQRSLLLKLTVHLEKWLQYHKRIGERQ